MKIIIIDDDPILREQIKDRLVKTGVHIDLIDEADQRKSAEKLLIRSAYDLAFVDLHLDDGFSGLSLVKKSTLENSYTIVLSSFDEEKYMKEAYAAGCDEYYVKDGTLSFIPGLLERFQRKKKFVDIHFMIKNDFITQDQKLIKQIENAVMVTSIEQPLYITGPLGVGKHTLAEGVHYVINGHDTPFRVYTPNNQSAENISIDLFGQYKDDKLHPGLLSTLKGGMLLIQDIMDFPISVQEKILETLEQGHFSPVGQDEKIKLETIFSFCITEENFKVGDNFCSSLYFKLTENKLSIPPLRKRKNDIPLLINKFQQGLRSTIIDEYAMKSLMDYAWPWNAFELKREIRRLMMSPTKKSGYIGIEDLGPTILANKRPRTGEQSSVEKNHEVESNFDTSYVTKFQREEIFNLGMREFVKRFKKECIKEFLKEFDGDYKKVTKILKIGPSTLYSILDGEIKDMK